TPNTTNLSCDSGPHLPPPEPDRQGDPRSPPRRGSPSRQRPGGGERPPRRHRPAADHCPPPVAAAKLSTADGTSSESSRSVAEWAPPNVEGATSESRGTERDPRPRPRRRTAPAGRGRRGARRGRPRRRRGQSRL